MQAFCVRYCVRAAACLWLCTPVCVANSIILQLQASGGDGISVPCGWTALSVCMCIPLPFACFDSRLRTFALLETSVHRPHPKWCGPLSTPLGRYTIQT